MSTLQNSHHKNGRPSKIDQLTMQRTLRPYFEQGISVTLMAEKTGINVKTVYKYFDFWIQEINEQETSNFLERQRKEKTRIIVSFDKQILEANKHFDDINMR